jgi:hypothetical protein
LGHASVYKRDIRIGPPGIEARRPGYLATRPIGASYREFFGVVALPKLQQHFLEVPDREHEEPLVRAIEKHGRDFAHPYDVAQVRLHIAVGP